MGRIFIGVGRIFIRVGRFRIFVCGSGAGIWEKKTTRTGEAVRTPAETSNTYYDTGSGVGTGYGARRAYTERGGHGFVSIRY